MSVSRRVLVTGLPGCGKSTLARRLPNSVDLDIFGYWTTSVTGKQVWIVNDFCVSWLTHRGQQLIALGNCENMLHQVEILQETPRRKAVKVRHSIRDLPWDVKIYLWYDATEAERLKRFGPDRENDWGKDDLTWKLIQEDSHAKALMRDELIQEGFVFIDTTWMPLDMLTRLVASYAYEEDHP